MRLDYLIQELADDCRWLIGGVPATARLNADWTDRLPAILEWGGEIAWRAAAGRLSRTLGLRRGHAAVEDWSGELEVWPDGDDRVMVRRIPFYDDGMTVETLAAARSPEAIARFVAAAGTLWRRWRREKEPVLGSHGRVLDGQPVRWQELILPTPLLDDVRTTVEAFARAGVRYRTWRMPYKRGLLFHGPPGNGKTLLCRAIVTALGWPMIRVESGDGHAIRHAFASARELAPCVLLFEDVDSLFDKDERSEFLNQLDGFDVAEGVLVLATTNHPEELDAALTARPSRFDRVYAVADPDREQRERYLDQLFASSALDRSAIAWLAAETDGMSMAFLKEVFLGAALRAAARDEDVPTLDDARRALPVLTTHRQAATNHFSTSRAPGFLR
jgi:ATPase family associated with various cellular activities (AAA)